MITKIQKTAFAISVCLFLSVLIVSAAHGDNVGFDKLKESTLSSIQRGINKISNAINTISNNPSLEESSKENIISKLKEIEGKLSNYSSEVESASNVTGLTSLNKEIIKYLKV